jgi:hypothetical protein
MIKCSETYFQHVAKIFQAAANVPPQERKGFLIRASAGDASLISEVEALLQSAVETGPLDHAPETPIDFGQLPVKIAAPLPAQIGEFKILQVIASGGMGTVYEALQ